MRKSLSGLFIILILSAVLFSSCSEAGEGSGSKSGFTVRFVVNGQEVGVSEDLEYGEPLSEPEVPEAPEGYYFTGWYKDNVKWKFIWGVAGDMTLEAKFDLIALKFECDSSFKVIPKFTNGVNLTYSVDGGQTWKSCSDSQEISVSDAVYFRGSGNSAFGSISELKSWSLVPDNGTDLIRCSGNIETLLDCDTVLSGEHPVMGNACFFALFNGCEYLETPPDLPSVDLAPYCYGFMFGNCTKLKTAPVLPETESFPPYCFMGMFQGCKRLHFVTLNTGEKPFLVTKNLTEAEKTTAAPYMYDGFEVLENNTSYYCYSF